MIYISLIEFEMVGNVYLDNTISTDMTPCINVPTSTDLGYQLFAFISPSLVDVDFKEEPESNTIENMQILLPSFTMINELMKKVKSTDGVEKEVFQRLLDMCNMKLDKYSNNKAVVIYVSY